MSNLKGKVSLLLALVMMMMTILPIATVNAVVDVTGRIMMTATASYNGKTLVDGQTLSLSSSDTNKIISVKISNIKFTGSGATYPEPNISKLQIGYRIDDGEVKTINGSLTGNITLPKFSAGSHSLQINARINDDPNYVGNSNIIKINFNVTGEDTNTTVVTTSLKVNGKTISSGSTVTVPVGTGAEITSSATNSKKVLGIAYKWDNGDWNQKEATKVTLNVPSTFKAGETHTLTVQAQAEDGTKSKESKYTFKIQTVEIDDDLVVEAWMRETKDLDSVSVSLRNDAEENEKSNRNIYALKEKVTYYVDYKNASSKTKKNIKIVLNLPLEVEVVDACGGVVDGKTITWEISELEEDEAGTKTVVVKYVSLGKASVKSKIVYPVADMYESKKVVDSSSVINLIFKDEDTEIVNDEHYPYMYGDKYATTFRPDEGITRAEGALVLTRIFGMNTSGVKITNVYPDLDETYIEAQRAVVAATNAGLINGYTDGTYRPNEKMTRAEFMKILAANIELAAEENDLDDNIVDGLRVRTSDEEIKIYKNPTKTYLVNGNSVSEHWASPYVTLLARLNMAGLTEKNKDLRLDEEITRAEVAQLVNFYLFRAPAEVNSKTKSGFSDVKKNHKLFADIVEATRDAHTYTLTLNGTEVAVDD